MDLQEYKFMPRSHARVVFIIITVCSAVKGTRFNNYPACLAGITLYGGEKVVKGVKKLPRNRRVHN